MKIDAEATRKRFFLDPTSVVLEDGREILKGSDYLKRKLEVWNAAGRRCVACGEFVEVWKAEMHHKIHRGSAGVDRDDRAENAEILCRGCHREEHVQVNGR